MVKEVAVTLRIEQWQIVAAGLGKLPLEVALAPFNAINAQLADALREPPTGETA
jgi:hypothetical protein